MIAFTTRIRSSLDVHNYSDISDDDMSDDALFESYKILYLKWNDVCKAGEKPKNKIEVLLQDKACLMNIVSKLKEILIILILNLKVRLNMSVC